MTLQIENKKKKELKLEPIKHLLLNPITDNDKEITELTFEPLTFSVYSDIDVEQDNDLVVEEFTLALTGISDKAFDQLSSPDFNSISDIVFRLVTKNSDDWLPGIEISNDKIQLALPIQGDDGRTITEIELKVPSVKTRKIYKAQPTDKKKQAFITHACSGLSETEIGRLFMPDWNQLQVNIDNFLNQQAGFFQTKI
ncbi:phage tail assembly protein [Vibrio sp. 1069]|uniref:phage tail assembly protein n=1 Tax=unclassified Vibrio TaxID=2614977 RepID=UPI0029640FC3|nr:MULTISPECIES: phage tail assembly protein [unclassified Vibrio]MDW1763131.1 phage tail assembly protein [Vibrio sp. Vb2135]MDW2333033.1 phage tail assembly protein [Vibrio sp. 1069]